MTVTVSTDERAWTIRPLDTDTWSAFAGLLERNGGMFASCWCTWFHPDCAERGVSYEGNRALKKQWVEDGTAHAALVMEDGQAVAWAQFGPPDELPNIHHRKQYLAEADLVPDYRITCIVVDKKHRRSGLAEVAARGALALVAAAGGGVVESYPHDLTEKKRAGKKVSSSFLYNGTRTMYERLGFDYVRPKGLGNCVMRTEVAPA